MITTKQQEFALTFCQILNRLIKIVSPTGGLVSPIIPHFFARYNLVISCEMRWCKVILDALQSS